MPRRMIGPITVEGSDGFVVKVGGAIAAADYPWARLRGKVTVTEVPSNSDQLLDLPSGEKSWATASPKRRTIVINAGIRRAWQKYVALHDLGHFVDWDLFSKEQKRPLMAAMKPPAGPGEWRDGPYQSQPAENFADAFAEEFGELVSPNRAYYTRKVDYAALRRITLTATGADEPAPEAPQGEPGPVPLDPCASLRTQVAELTANLRTSRRAEQAAVSAALRVKERLSVAHELNRRMDDLIAAQKAQLEEQT